MEGQKTRLWNKDEKDLLRAWVDENPGVRVSQNHALKELSDLLPGRTPNQIYAMWYWDTKKRGLEPAVKVRTAGSKPVHTLTKLPVQPYSAGKFDYISRLNDQIGQMVEEQAKARYLPEIIRLKSECEKLQGELEKAKGMLRLTKDIRVAAYKFGKEYAGMNIR